MGRSAMVSYYPYCYPLFRVLPFFLQAAPGPRPRQSIFPACAEGGQRNRNWVTFSAHANRYDKKFSAPTRSSVFPKTAAGPALFAFAFWLRTFFSNNQLSGYDSSNFSLHLNFNQPQYRLKVQKIQGGKQRKMLQIKTPSPL